MFIEQIFWVLIFLSPFFLIPYGVFLLVKKKNKLFGTLFILIGFMLLLFSLKFLINKYTPYIHYCNDEGKRCTSEVKNCLCVGRLGIMYSYPAQYECIGMNMCLKSNAMPHCEEKVDYFCIRIIQDKEKCYNKTFANTCLYNIARETINPDICNEITEQDIKASCITNVTRLERINKCYEINNTKNSVTNLRAGCIINLSRLDSGICNEVKVWELRNICRGEQLRKCSELNTTEEFHNCVTSVTQTLN